MTVETRGIGILRASDGTLTAHWRNHMKITLKVEPDLGIMTHAAELARSFLQYYAPRTQRNAVIYCRGMPYAVWGDAKHVRVYQEGVE